jgi:LPS sulfotransferase NodH
MRRENPEQTSRCANAVMTVAPSPSASRPPDAFGILRREFNRLREQTSADRLRLACAQRWNHWRRWCHWVAKRHQPYQAVFVIATPRSGSNLLIDYLDWLPGVGCLPEVLNWGGPIGPKKLLHAQQIVKHLQRSLQTLHTTHRTCKIFLHELKHYRLTIDDLEQAFPTARYLVLNRENLAEQYISQQVAKLTGQWSLLPGQPRKNAAISIDPADLAQYCQKVQSDYAAIVEHRAIARRGAMLSYEELVANSDRCLREIVCPLLGASFSEPRTAYRKQNVKSLVECVINYSEVAALLNGPLCRLQLHSTGTGRSKAA